MSDTATEFACSLMNQIGLLQDAIKEFEQNERAYAAREKELQSENEALRKVNLNLHNARIAAEEKSAAHERSAPLLISTISRLTKEGNDLTQRIGEYMEQNVFLQEELRCVNGILVKLNRDNERSVPARLCEDLRNLENKVQKLGQDVQALMNPVEIVDPAPNQCDCNSCKWERHVAGGSENGTR